MQPQPFLAAAKKHANKAASEPVRVVALGDSLFSRDVSEATYNRTDESFLTYAEVASGSRFRIVKNLGVASETSTQILARVGNVAQYEPQACFILAGTNDPTGIAASTTLANIESMIDTLLRQGIEPVLFTLPATNTTADQAHVAKVNYNLHALAAERGLPLVDLFAVTVDESALTWASGLSGDGTHPNQDGAKLMGLKIVADLADWLPATAPYLPKTNVDPINLVTNGLFLTDTAGVPTGWSSSGAGVATLTVEADATIPGQWAAIEKTDTASYRQLLQSISTGFSVGDTILFCGRVDFTVESGDLSAFVEVTLFNTGASVKPLSSWQSDIEGVFYLTAVVPSGCTQLQVKLGGVSGTGKVRFAQVALVNLTTQAAA